MIVRAFGNWIGAFPNEFTIYEKIKESNYEFVKFFNVKPDSYYYYFGAIILLWIIGFFV